MQAHLLWSNVDDAEVDRQLDAARAAGARLVRVDVGWTTLEEAGKANYSGWYLARIDRLVEKAEARGLQLLLTVLYSPCWASSAPASVKQDCSPGWWERGVASYPPTDVSHYADVMSFLAARYRGRVTGWELWNEPNLPEFWRAADPARSYVELVRAAYPAIKRADPQATVVAGALADAAYGFTDDLYRSGIEGNFDALSIHPYSGDNSPLDRLQDAYMHASFVRGVPAVRSVMSAHGDERPIWLTEFGYNTSSVRGSDAWLNGVDEETQATYLAQAFAQMQKWSYVDVGVWYGLKDRGPDRMDPQHNYGLLRYDHSQKPAYAAYASAAGALVDGSPPSPPASDRRGGGEAVPASAAPPVHYYRPRGAATGAGPVRFRIITRRGSHYVAGWGPPNAVVVFAGYRYSRRRGFRSSPSIKLRLRISASGRFLRRLPRKRAVRGKWRFLTRSPAGQGYARVVVLRPQRR